MNWKKGPLPANTWQWGAIVPFDHEGTGFCFADFCGDHVKCLPGGKVLKAHEVAWWTNCLELPPEECNVVGRAEEAA